MIYPPEDKLTKSQLNFP